ncbi:MAG: hypothetical protein V7723_15230 [Sneathiella sp.]|uniref:hypothetical protein n=1 Tax=Sneathiella sp. TaxID=1964365 RepID=UPI00300122F1
METSKVNDLQVMLTGAPTFSWLAGQSYEIGLDEPVEKLLAPNGHFLKINHETCLVFGEALADDILQEWNRAPPDGVLLHKLDDGQRGKLMDWLGSFA